MGQAADRKVSEIEAVRHQLESDLQEIEERLPAPLRSVKSLIGILLGTAITGVLVRRLLSRRADRSARPEVIVRIVREDR